ncbi:ElyC/SanA/YdcF family protein [uncultured Vibrio sp.]|uniref:SanA/YdcF family protein n=1 Tax=uncultured Vibrio sp. TaxID=114054 RepID=UPI00091292CB|nr:ElyC/SanA/YdcF family protein [uncultured Vibrio sp.]OIQ26624.1 MAG: membrane permeability protein SanA [Vibrio sp. MedPE-SWchi]
MGAAKSANIIVELIVKLNSQITWKRSFQALRYALIFLLVSISLLALIDRWVSWKTSDTIISDSQLVERYDVAVVLGTSKYLGRTLNEYYQHRIDAAIELFDQDKIDDFLLSGDNAHRSYNEPWTMKRDLLRAGVPEQNIYLDYAGFRTLDSVIRAKEIFESDDFLIITQRFHCERALFIAKHHNINAHCLAVSGPKNHSGYKVRLREVFARAKAVLDLYVINTQPKFLGPKEPIINESVLVGPPEEQAPLETTSENQE